MKHNMPTIEELLAHYTGLAGTPGWKQYCWHRVNELAAQKGNDARWQTSRTAKAHTDELMAKIAADGMAY